MQPRLTTWPAPLPPFLPGSPAADPPTTTTALTKTTNTTTNTTTTSTSHASVIAENLAQPSAPVMVMAMPTEKTAWAASLLHQQKTGVPPLHQTIIDHDDEMAGILLAAGADLRACILTLLSESEVIDVDKRPAASIVYSSRGLSDLGRRALPPNLSTEEIVEFVLYAKARAPQENLHYAGANALTLSLLAGAPFDFLKKLCDAGSRQCPGLLSARDKLGRTPLVIAAQQGKTDVIKLLLEFKANPNVEDAQGLKPLDHALKNGHAEVTRLLVRHGIADPKTTRWKIRGYAHKHANEGPVRLLTKLFGQHDMATLLDYQQQSARHRVAVFQVLVSLCKQAVGSGAPGALDTLLGFAKPLLTTNRLGKIAVAIARRPGKLPELMSVLQRIGDDGFPKKKLAALRDAAGKSRDPAMLELAISLDPSLTQLLDSTTRPNKKQLAQLNRLLALAMQVRDDALMLRLKDRGAKLTLADPALAGLPMISILADSRNPQLLRSAMLAREKNAGPGIHQQLVDAINEIQTGEGLITLTHAFKAELNGYEMHQLLCRAVDVRDEWAVDELVKAGANVNYIATLTMGNVLLNAGEATPLSTAIATGNLPMLNKLITLGAALRMRDVNAAFQVSREFGLAVEALT